MGRTTMLTKGCDAEHIVFDTDGCCRARMGVGVIALASVILCGRYEQVGLPPTMPTSRLFQGTNCFLIWTCHLHSSALQE